MKITDEQLSAFLDAALPEAEMQQVREQLALNDDLVARLADLAMVDPILQQHYSEIEQRPVPAALLALLAENDAPTAANDSKPNNVVSMSRWRRVEQHWQRYAAAVACVALFGGYGLSQLNHPTSSTMLAIQPAVQQHLSQSPSGQRYQIANEQLTPQLSFVNKNGDFCRQYSVESATARTENIACQQQGEWQLKASLAFSQVSNNNGYQTASGPSALDSVLDELMAGPALTLAEEQLRLQH
ncbi:hypothetical protein LMJ53_10830 [Rheinheimera sp. UJ51]|uniref:anti-sigma factor family protein n=1 Tax=unclassified Rheinheimera TaxID=115860 RepID=UPI001E38F3A4|nr:MULTISPECIES: hypothetical protein [unclassified Rheinheimera]MCC5452215.1 hypothetical protein [Rheinheimera sp. UJ51]MCF4010772.1 hypothetical protein [Rheinheimera sp. UJ63]